MANLSQFLAPTQGPRAVAQNGPGSNGFWQREAYFLPGAYEFVVKRSGLIRISGLGPGTGGRLVASASAQNAGSGGGLSIDERQYVKGDKILVTIGAGSVGVGAANPADAGTTTITCAARGLEMVIPGGKFLAANVRPTGGNICNFLGGKPTVGPAGGASSGTPLGDGHNSQGNGGSGWGAPSNSSSGTGSTDQNIDFLDKGTISRTLLGSAQPFWDFADIRGSASTLGINASGANGAGSHSINRSGAAGSAGVGGGGGHNTGNGGSNHGDHGGAGGGGGSTFNTNGNVGGNGGNGLVLIHWDEVF